MGCEKVAAALRCYNVVFAFVAGINDKFFSGKRHPVDTVGSCDPLAEATRRPVGDWVDRTEELAYSGTGYMCSSLQALDPSARLFRTNNSTTSGQYDSADSAK